MPLTCILCKQEYNPIDGSRSFHRFPQDKNLREKWMQIVGVSAIKSHMAICSKHFEPSSYYDTCGYTSRRRLQKTAVPILEKCSEPLILASSQLKDLKKLTCSSQLTKDHSRNTIQEGEESYETTDSGTKRKIVSKDESGIGSEPLILASSQLKNLKKLTCSSQLTKDHSRNTIQEGKESCEITDSGTKRKIVSKNESGIHNKRIRFTHNCQMIQISREDCVSDEAWNRFMMLITYKNKQIRAARQKSNRNIKKQQRIQELLGVVKAKKNSSVTNYLQVTTK